MSRARVHEVSSPISLFPFIGILLCTMGALIVVLVAVSRSARTSAERQVQSKQTVSAKPANDADQKKLEEIKSYAGKLDSVRSEAERKLRDEQLRLSHVEDHIRRLHEKIRSMESSAIELHALEEEHYDDHQQAEREVQRLNQLIEDSKKTVDSMREVNGKASRSYAVVPYEGPNGTFRRPIYIECVKNELIIQPEGVRISVDDLRPPLGPGNPLAAVLRACRDYLVRLNPQLGQTRDLEPYPLLLVRPDGLVGYDRARQAIEAGDFDLGFELVESDWKLKYPQADSQLASLEEQALNQARLRQQVLAAAAPRAYRGASMAAAGEFDFDDGPESGGGRYGGGGGGGPGGRGIGSGQPGGGNGGGGDMYVVRSNRRGAGSGSGGESDDGEAGNYADRGDGASSENGGAPGGSSGGSSQAGKGGTGSGRAGQNTASAGAASGGTFGSGGGSPPPPGGAPDKNLTPDGYESSPQTASAIAGSPPPAPDRRNSGFDSRNDQTNPMEHRGKDWALRQKPARAVPVRRTIHVTVAANQLVIVPDSGPATTGGKAIPLRADTVESIDEFVKQVREHIDGWGIAGDGLYWRPVVQLSVRPDGERRANDLSRLLKNSGLELRADETARVPPQGTVHETR